MATSTTNRKLGKLYEGLSERERVRMMAKLAREHKPDEMNRLRDATPPEHAETYNRTLKLLRTLNGNTLDWIGLSRLGMERDRMRLQAFTRDLALNRVIAYRLIEMWHFIAYPITESEYRTIVERYRGEPYALDDYAEYLAESGDDGNELAPQLEAAFENLPPELEPISLESPEPFNLGEWRKQRETPEYQEALQRETERTAVIAKRIRSILDAAIKRGELPKPKRRKGGLVLPWGELEDWATGTTPETTNPGGPGSVIPMLLLFQGQMAYEWDIRPDSEAEAVKERREKMLRRLPMPPTIPESARDEIGTLDPPLTTKARERDEARAQELREKWYSHDGITELVHNAAETYAEARAQLEGLAEALEIIQRDDFAGEDPLFPEIRAHLEIAQDEAERFVAVWEQANSVEADVRSQLYRLQGLEPPAWDSSDAETPAPLPTVEPVTDEMLALIRGWGE